MHKPPPTDVYFFFQQHHYIEVYWYKNCDELFLFQKKKIAKNMLKYSSSIITCILIEIESVPYCKKILKTCSASDFSFNKYT